MTENRSSLADVVEYHKLHPLGESTEQLSREIEERGDMLKNNLKELLYREGEVDNLILRLPGHDVVMDRTRQSLEKDITSLRMERNREQKQYWKDVIGLKQTLQETIAEYERSKGLLSVKGRQGSDTGAGKTSKGGGAKKYHGSIEDIARYCLERVP